MSECIFLLVLVCDGIYYGYSWKFIRFALNIKTILNERRFLVHVEQEEWIKVLTYSLGLCYNFSWLIDRISDKKRKLPSAISERIVVLLYVLNQISLQEQHWLENPEKSLLMYFLSVELAWLDGQDPFSWFPLLNGRKPIKLSRYFSFHNPISIRLKLVITWLTLNKLDG